MKVMDKAEVKVSESRMKFGSSRRTLGAHQGGGVTIGRAIFEPRLAMSTSLKPLAKTKSCEGRIFNTTFSGTLQVRMDVELNIPVSREMYPCSLQP